jgi:S1-C subfamily serine protease
VLTLLFLPFRVLGRLLTLAFLLIAITSVAFLGYAALNHLEGPPPVSVAGLESGTVALRAQGRAGTGAIVQEDGRWSVLTAAHVVGNSRSVEVRDRYGGRQRGTVTAVDRERDVAVVSVRPGRDWVALRTNPALPPPGQKVTTLCYFDAAVRHGPFAGPVDDVRIGDQHITRFDLDSWLTGLTSPSEITGDSILALMGAEPGCSGAPLLNKAGEVIGIIVAGNSRSTIATSIAAAFGTE